MSGSGMDNLEPNVRMACASLAAAMVHLAKLRRDPAAWKLRKPQSWLRWTISAALPRGDEVVRLRPDLAALLYPRPGGGA